MSESRCAIGLLTWNGERDVARCARSILDQTEKNIEIRWIDNASSDGTCRRVIEGVPGFPKPDVLEANVGFCAGHNRAFSDSNAPYYLALNQDVELAPDYVEKVCDWMDAEASLAMASGLILQSEAGAEGNRDARIYSSGMAMGRGRCPFELRMGERPAEFDRERRFVPAVTGAALMVRRSAVAELSPRPRELFPAEMFAYFEEVDLALRIARAGLRCGVEGSALAWHAARGQGGASDPAIRVHYLKNHWLVTLRNDAWSEIALEIPHIVKGELRHYLPNYISQPLVSIRAAWLTMRQLAAARRNQKWLSEKFPNGRRERLIFLQHSREELRREIA